jgi:solute:Na+ symporter, SSS family
MSETLTYLAIIGVYMVVILGLAVYIAKVWIDDPGDFMLAGREIGGILTGFSTAAILISGGFVPTIVLYGYTAGIGGAWFFWGWGVGVLLVMLTWLLIWRRSGAYTPAEYFEYQYGVSGRLAILFGSLISMALIASYQFVGAGSLLAGLIGIDITIGIIGIGVFTIVYAMLSGMWGISISDFIQALWVIVAVFTIIPIYLYVTHGLPTPGASENIEPSMWALPFGQFDVLSFAGGTAISVIFLQFTVANAPYYWVRSSAARNERAVKTGYIIAAMIAFFTGLMGALIGLWAQMLVPGAEDPSLAFGELVGQEIPILIGALAMSGVIAATMSTVDIVYQSIANTVTRDYVQRFTDISNRDTLLKISRVTILVVGPLTVAAAIIYPGSLDAFIAFAFSFVVPLIILNFDSWLTRYGTKEATVVMFLAMIPTVTYWDLIGDGTVPALPLLDSVAGTTVDSLWVSLVISVVLFYGISFVVRVTGPWWSESVINAAQREIKAQRGD